MWSFPDTRQGKALSLTALLWVVGGPTAHAESAGFRTRELPWAALGSPYHAVVETFVDGRCIDGGISLSVVEGVLPRGLSLRGDAIGGIPEEFGAFALRLRAANGCAAEERDFVLQITGGSMLRVTPEVLELEYRMGDPVPETRVLLVSSSWPRLAYYLNRGAEPWLRTRQQAGMTPLAGSPYAGDVVRVEIAPEKLTPGKYESILMFSGPSGAAPVTVPVRLHVIAAQ
jgi:hypothetical protein